LKTRVRCSMSTMIHIAPYVSGPTMGCEKAQATRVGFWRQLLSWLFGPSPTARPAPSKPVARWAFRVTNYGHLRARGLPCVVAAPSAAAGVSSYLDLQALEADSFQEGDIVLIESGQTVPCDGTVVEGAATVEDPHFHLAAVHSSKQNSTVLRDSRAIEG